MKRYLFIFVLAAIFSSCKKDHDDCPAPEPAPVATPANNFYKLAVGNYWVYQSYRVDTNGVETLEQTSLYDSSYVQGDTVLHGNTYYIIHDFISLDYLRDSSGFIVDTAGVIHFTNAVFNLPVVTMNYGVLGYAEIMTVSTPVSVTVPAGTFTAYDWKTTVHFSPPNYPWGNTRYADEYLSEGIGKVKQRWLLSNSPDYHERRLVRYHVQ